MAYSAKTYIVQRADANGNLRAETPIAVKLTFEAAQKIARMPGIAPAKVTLLIADKSDKPNGEGQYGHYSVCKPEPFDSRRVGFDQED